MRLRRFSISASVRGALNWWWLASIAWVATNGTEHTAVGHVNEQMKKVFTVSVHILNRYCDIAHSTTRRVTAFNSVTVSCTGTRNPVTLWRTPTSQQLATWCQCMQWPHVQLSAPEYYQRLIVNTARCGHGPVTILLDTGFVSREMASNANTWSEYPEAIPYYVIQQCFRLHSAIVNSMFQWQFIIPINASEHTIMIL